MSESVRVRQLNLPHTKTFLAFSLGKEEYGIPLSAVKEVVALTQITRVPHAPGHFLGIMNLRGQVVSVFDMRLKFGIQAENGEDTAVIVCDYAPLMFGMVVNSVNRVLSLADDEIQDRPEMAGRHKSEHIIGVAKKEDHFVLLLDVAKALNIEDHLAISSTDLRSLK